MSCDSRALSNAFGCRRTTARQAGNNRFGSAAATSPLQDSGSCPVRRPSRASGARIMRKATARRSVSIVSALRARRQWSINVRTRWAFACRFATTSRRLARSILISFARAADSPAQAAFDRRNRGDAVLLDTARAGLAGRFSTFDPNRCTQFKIPYPAFLASVVRAATDTNTWNGRPASRRAFEQRNGMHRRDGRRHGLPAGKRIAGRCGKAAVVADARHAPRNSG